MKRYFFDVNAKGCVEYDYSGRYLLGLEHAQQMAELIAMDLGCTTTDVSYKREVQVRDASGQHLLTVPVQPIDELAA
jgi:hypothetical protein